LPDNSENNNTFAENNSENGKGSETRMDNRKAMEYGAIRELVDRPEERSGIYRTIEAGNTAGSVSAILEVEELEELESRGINPYWDKKKFQNELRKQAQENGVWLDKSYLDDKKLLHDQKAIGTSEHDVYLNSDNKTLTKLNNLAYVTDSEHNSNLSALIDRFSAHNELFPEVAYTIKGFMDNLHGNPALVLEQPFIDAERNATKEEIHEYFNSRGFKLDGKRSWANLHEVWSNGKYELFDARPANVLKGKDGNLYFFDTIPHSTEYVGDDSENNNST
jgi:hypothetical protein